MPNKQEYFQGSEIIENGLTRSPEFIFGLSNGGEMLEASGRYGGSYLSVVPAEYKPACDSDEMKSVKGALSW